MAEEAAAQGATLAAPELPPEVEGGGTLADALRAGELEAPPLVTWNEWQQWRSRTGRVPGAPRHRATLAAFQRREVGLWRETMAVAHGARWRESLEDRELRDALDGAERDPLAAAAAAGAPAVAGRAAGARPLLEQVEAAARAGRALEPAGRAATPPRSARAAAEPASPEVARALVLTPASPERDEDASSLSAGSWSALSVEELRQKAYGNFDPSMESLVAYEGRVFRAVALLEKRGEAVVEESLQRSVIRARYAMEIAGQEPSEAARTLRACLASALEDGDGDDQEDARAEVLVEMLQACAPGPLGGILGRIFTPQSGPASGGTGRTPDRPPAPAAEPPPASAAPGPAQASRGPEARHVTGTAPGATAEATAAPLPTAEVPQRQEPAPTAPVAQVPDVISQALVALLEERRQSSTAGRGTDEEPRSTIQVRPTLHWPHLGDDDFDVELFLEEFEETVGLANNCTGMNYREKLRVLGSCLKQSRAKAYKVVVQAARRSGELEADPRAIYDRVCSRLLEFREGLIEQQTRADRLFENCSKGKLSAVQFLPVWEAVVAELDLKGIGKSDRELLLAYMKRCGPAARTEVLKDRRPYATLGGAEETRQVRTWPEAHRGFSAGTTWPPR